MKNYDRYKEPSHLKYQDVNDLYGRVMSHNLRAGGFKWVKSTSQFN